MDIQTMKKLCIVLCAALCCSALFAQNRVLDTRPAHGGKDLTMEDAIFKGVGYARMAGQWLGPDNFAVFDGTQWKQGSLSARELEDFKPSLKEKAPAPCDIRLEGNSLMGIRDGKEFPIGLSEDRNIVYGGTMMRNEFGFTRGYEWAPSHSKIAFYKKDQSRVTDFPLLNIQTRTGELELLKYPMNGMDSELLQVGVYDFVTEKTVWLAVDDFTPERFITNLAWSADDKYVFAQVLDRSQHHMRLNQYRASDGSYVRTLFTEDNDAWVEPEDPLYPVKGRTDLYIYRTDNRDGYRNLYLLDTLGGIRRLTAIDADVAYLGNDGTAVYYTSAEVSPIENHLFSQSMKFPKKQALAKAKLGKPQQLTQGRGWHNVQLNEDCQWFLDHCSSLNSPGTLTLCSVDGKQRRQLVHLEDPLLEYASCTVELGTVPSADGQWENYYRLIYPKDFDPSRRYPVILYVYGGPHSQLVRDTWLGEIRMWEMLMAQRGYLVYIQDNRGTSNRGAAFEKAINRQCGQAEMADQMVGINWFRSLPFVDASRIGVHGWS